MDHRLASTSVSRRLLLQAAAGSGLALATAGLTSCRSTPPAAAPPATVASMLASTPFYVAHRGGGGDWPEMTAYAYERAASLPGLQALEISVCLSADGVLVCSHDPTTTRVTGVPLTIAKETWATLSELRVRAQNTTDPDQPARPLARFEEIAEAYADRFVLFVEPKVPAATAPLVKQLVALGQPERIVWKQYINSPLFAGAKSRGFSTWGYVLDEPSHTGANLLRLARDSHIDMLGARVEETAELVSDVVRAASSNGKQTIMSVVRDEADRDRALRLGCTGLMASRITELLGTGTGGG